MKITNPSNRPMSAMLSQTPRERLCENLRTASSCARRRNLTRQNHRTNRQILIERAYRRYTSTSLPPTDVWRSGRSDIPYIGRDIDREEEDADDVDTDDGMDSVMDEEDDVDNKNIDIDSDSDCD